MGNKIRDFITIESKVEMLEKNINRLTKEVYDMQKLKYEATKDVKHMYSIVKQLHKEHEMIMKLNGHETLLTTIDKLME